MLVLRTTRKETDDKEHLFPLLLVPGVMVVEIGDPVGHNLTSQAQVGPPLVQMDLSCHRQKIKVKIKI